MRVFGRTPPPGADPANVQAQAMIESGGGRSVAVISALALVFSGYSMWDTSLREPDVRLFVPSVLSYSSPYQNSNFEVIGIPVTLTNEGARTATVLQLDLSVTNPRTGETKRFYSAAFGTWTMEKARSGANDPFAPISLPGRTSRSENILFYTRGAQEKPNEVIRQPGPYILTLSVVQAEDQSWFGRFFRRGQISVTFERDLPFYDARAFQNGTLPLYSREWRAVTGEGVRTLSGP